ncbi:MAG: hypothetical protein J6D06_06855 [Clostridia bacterium]|nr:hypothetical protein [Clostridia bacterium]
MKYVYKIVAALGALAVILVAIVAPLVHIEIDSLLPGAIVTIGALLKDEAVQDVIQNTKGEIPSGIYEDISIKNLISPNDNSIAQALTQMGGEVSEETMKALEPVMAPLITFVVVLALILICAIATAVVAFATKNNRNVYYLSVAGIFISLMASPCMKAIAAPFVNGDVTLESLTGSEWAFLIGEITELSLSSSFWLVPLVFAGIILWTFLYNATLPEKEKRERKLMLGEAD